MYIQYLAQQFFEYSRLERNYTPRTIRRYRQIINFYCKYQGVEEIEQVTEDNIRDLFYFGRGTRNWTAQTFRGYYKTLNVFFNWCIEKGYMHSNPVKQLKQPKLEESIPKPLSKQDAERLLEFVDNFPFESPFLRFRNYALFATIIYSGLRKEELLHLKYMDVDLENLSIFVRMGKGQKDRIVPINYRLADALKRYVEIRKKQFKTCPEFFTSYTYDMGFTESGLRRLVLKMRKTSGIFFGCHILRHTFATLMLEGGCDIVTLSKLMGHASIQTTLIYLKVAVHLMRTQISKHPLFSYERSSSDRRSYLI